MIDKHQLFINFNFLKKADFEELIKIDNKFIKNIIMEFNTLSALNRKEFELKAFHNSINSSLFYLGVEEEIEQKEKYNKKKIQIEDFVKNNYFLENNPNVRIDFCKRRISNITTSRLIAIVVRLKQSNKIKGYLNNDENMIYLYFPIEFIRTKK